ncbi:MAG: proline--tRNA ligase [Deltaproteobacteria bacterium]|nr:proline--tRNA ligase [Deltaproteobacteria bacterium]
MKWSSSHIPTLREAPQEAEVVSHQLMMRAGMIRKLAAGIYSFLPLGWKVIFKTEAIIREEMNRSGAQEVQLPFVQPKELWEESGRWSLYAKEMARLKDRHEHDFCLQPTSEEAITDLVRRDVKSYRQLPLNFYQIQTKFRDEIRPRFGIMRGREFIMKDAYSFDIDEASAIKSYEEMRKAYRRIFTRTGLNFKPVDADTGAIGGSRSEEFTVLADSGEDEIVSCESCDYGANQEKATAKIKAPEASALQNLEEFATPGLKTIEDLGKSLSLSTSALMKTMIATDSEGRCIVVLLRGDHQLHEVKLGALLSKQKNLKGVRLATDEELRIWKLPKGSLGPANFPRENFSKGVLLVVDDAISESASYIGGANKEGFHFRNIQLTRDAKVDVKGTIRSVQAGESCPNCGRDLKIFRGIEVGHVFYLGKKYSEAMKCEVTDESGKLKPIEMGCYGIGVGRTVAACIEQNHDKDGIIWPLSMAPYELAIISLGEGAAVGEAEKLYQEFRAAGVDVIWDDRSASPGVKLKDVDLVGIPYQIIVGEKGLKNQQVEWKIRAGSLKEFVALTEIREKVLRILSEDRETLKKKAMSIL